MRTFIRTLLVVFCLCPLLSAADYGNISVVQLSMSYNSQNSSHGYQEHRFRVSNKDKKAHRVALSLPNSHYGNNETSITRLARSIEVPPESSAILTLLQPPVTIRGDNSVQVIIDGRWQRDPMAVSASSNHMDGYKNEPTAIILTSQDVPQSSQKILESGAGKESKTPDETEIPEGEITPTTLPRAAAIPPGGAGPDKVVLDRAVLPVSGWSDNWLAYSHFDGVAVTSTEWKELQEQHPAISKALQQYTEAGGTLIVIGTDWTAPKEWVREGGVPSIYRAALGNALVMEKDAPNVLVHPLVLNPSMRWDTAFGQTYSGTRYYGRYGGGSQAPLSSDTPLLTAMPVVKEYGVSVRLVLAFIVIFAVLIGPVNIYALSKMKRRIWLLWTVPALSLAASVIVFGVSFLKEGFLRQASSATYTVLDQRRETATSFGFVGYYATLTPNAVFFSPHTEATACVNRSYSSTGRSLEVDILPDGTQQFSSRWIAARVPSYFMLRKSEPMRKERMLFDWSSAQPTATNGLGVALDKLAVCAADGKIYEAENIQPGEKITLKDTGTKTPENNHSDTLRHIQADYNVIFNGNIPSMATRTLSPHTYLATASAWNPFIESGIDRMRPYSNQTVIYGFFE